jgi:short-subunit dehydrogenase
MSTKHEQQRWRDSYGPWAVITGASDGIGRATAEQLAGAGLNLVLVARRHRVLDDLAAELSAEHDVATRVVAVDLATDEGVSGVLDATEGLDAGLLAACAGFGTSGPFLSGDAQDELEMLEVNCRSTLVLAHTFGRRFADRGRGGIVLMSSIVAFQGVRHAAHYAATKAYVQTLAEGLHLELAPLGVDVIASAPGPVDSGFAQRADMQLGTALQPSTVASGTLRALGRRSTVRPGWLSKVLEAALTLPRWARVRIMAIVMGGMTGHQQAGPATRAARSWKDARRLLDREAPWDRSS